MMKNNKFKKFMAGVLVSALCFAPLSANAEGIDNILFGSWNGTTTNHAGSFMEFAVEGAGSLTFDVNNYGDVKIKIDDNDPTFLMNQSYELGAGHHEISLFVEKVSDRKEGVTFNTARLTSGTFAKSQKEQYLFIGDSLFEGYNALGDGLHSYENSIPYRIGEIMDVVPVAVAAPGSGIVCKEIFSTVEDMAFKNEINCNPTKIFISAGSNDIKLNISPLEEKASYQHLINTVHDKFPNATIYCLVPLYGQAYNSVMHEMTGCEIIDTNGWQITFTDKIHPDAESQLIYAENVCAYLGKPVYEGFDAKTNFPSTITDPKGIALRAEIMAKRDLDASLTELQVHKGQVTVAAPTAATNQAVTNNSLPQIKVDIHE